MLNRRLMILYLRSRGVAYTIPGLFALVVLTAWDSDWLDWAVQGVAVVFIAMLATILLTGGFSTPSPELDATASLSWWRWRAGHILAGLAICALPLAAAVAYHRHGGAALDPGTARNVLGLAGLAFLTAVFAGARLSWTVPFVYTVVAWRIPPQSMAWAQVWRWPALPGNVELSWWPALGICAVGATLLAMHGAASRSDG